MENTTLHLVSLTVRLHNDANACVKAGSTWNLERAAHEVLIEGDRVSLRLFDRWENITADSDVVTMSVKPFPTGRSGHGGFTWM